MDALKAYVSDSEDSNSPGLEEEASEILDEVESEKHDFFGIHSEQSFRTKKNEKVGKVSRDAENNKHDVFSIFSEETFENRENDTSEKLKHETSVQKSVNIDNEQVTVEIPSSSFWRDLPVADIEVDQQTETLDGRKREDLHKQYKKHILSVGQKRTIDNYGNQKCLKRTKVPDETSFKNKELKIKGCDSNEKRKLYFVHSKIAPHLHSRRISSKISATKEWDNLGHAGAINRLKWNIPSYSHLLVTCSMDSTIKMWNVWSQLDSCMQVLRVHSKAVRDVAFSQDGKHLLSGSYDKSAVVSDVERGVTLSKLEHSGFVTCCKYHPVNHHVCVIGTNNQIQVWDVRTPSTPCRFLAYKDNIGQVQDVVLTGDGSTLFSCSDLVSRDSADRNLMAWDFHSGIVLSNQMYQERFTLTRLQIHPTENQLLAQSSGNYVVLFSLQRPYKMNKHKRFEGHKLQGYNIGFDVSPDGQTVYSGSADGKLYCYNNQSGKHLRTVDTGLQVAMDIACHPLLPSTVAVSSWDGTVQVWK